LKQSQLFGSFISQLWFLLFASLINFPMGFIFVIVFLCFTVKFMLCIFFSIETIGKQDKTQKYKQLSSKIQQSPKLRQRGVKESQNRRNPNPPYKESTKYCNHQAKIEETQTQYKGSIKYCSNSSVNDANLDTTMKEKRRKQMEMADG